MLRYPLSAIRVEGNAWGDTNPVSNINDLVGYQRRRIKELEAEIDRMAPVVSAATAWEDSFTGTQAGDDLERAVQVYLNKKPAPSEGDGQSKFGISSNGEYTTDGQFW